MKKDVFLHFKDGQRLEGGLTRPFSINQNELKVAMADTDVPSIFLFDELSAILFLDGSCPANIAPSIITWKR